jgi:hypothetical protein
MDEHRFPTGEELLADARRSFPQYYLLGDEEEICALNALVLAQAAFVVAVNAVRPKSDMEAAEALEKTTNYTGTWPLQTGETSKSGKEVHYI